MHTKCGLTFPDQTDAVSLINKTIKVIKSCITPEQIITAKRYCDLSVKYYRRCYNGSTKIEWAMQGVKAMKFEKELEQLLNEQMETVIRRRD